MNRIICLLIGYAFGLFQSAYLIGKKHGIDIRTKGSGNAGTTNAIRTLGTKTGLLVMCCDIGKCILAVLVTWLIFRNSDPAFLPLAKIYTSAGVILGHDFPFYLYFKGGKGIAATAGMIIAFGDYRLILIGILVFFGFFLGTHYVSLASLSLSLSFLVGTVAIGGTGKFRIPSAVSVPMPVRKELYVIVLLLTVLAFWGHRGNIARLAGHNERKTYLHKKK